MYHVLLRTACGMHVLLGISCKKVPVQWSWPEMPMGQLGDLPYILWLRYGGKPATLAIERTSKSESLTIASTDMSLASSIDITALEQQALGRNSSGSGVCRERQTVRT